MSAVGLPLVPFWSEEEVEASLRGRGVDVRLRTHAERVERDGAAGEVRLGDDRAPTVTEPGANVLRGSR
jgi:hypothetical protein